MDKTILFVTSQEARALRKDLVSFHKSFKLVFNEDVMARTKIKKGWWAEITYASKDSRQIDIKLTEERTSSRCRKVSDPKFSKVTEYLSIRFTQLIWEWDLCLFGAFEYEWDAAEKKMTIHF